MICIISLVVFSVLGLFSAKYRSLARMAFSCVTRRLTFRPCEMAFDQKVRMKLVAKLSGRSMPLARFVNKRFQILSWIFTVLLFVSLAFTSYSLYNLAVYGSCDPHSDICYLNPATYLTGGVPDCGSQHCTEEGCDCGPQDTNCTQENNYTACEGNCDCNETICG